jgi:WD40 repeat protein
MPQEAPMATSKVIIQTVNEPYVGPNPFQRKDAHIFFGRDREARDLMSCVIAHSETVFYAQSGAGKTSLINAKLLPLFEAEEFDIFPLARVQGPLQGPLQDVAPRNIYAFHTLISWAGANDEPSRLAGLSLAEYLSESPHKTDEYGIAKLRIVIFDQFEELFTFYPERWKERRGFFEQVRESLDQDPLLRILFSLREDHVAQLDPYATFMPEKMRTRYRLERLRKPAALDAVKRPLESTDYSFASGVAEKLINDLLQARNSTHNGHVLTPGGDVEFVEPVQLQVVCQSLWESLRREGQAARSKVITDSHIQECADVDKALSGFYEKCLQRTVAEKGMDESRLRNWFEHALITSADTRGMAFQGEEETLGLPNDVVEFLENLYLIRPERRGNDTWYELTHDRLIKPIRESNRLWRAQQSGVAQAVNRFEERALEWKKGRAGLLSVEEWLEARRWLSDPSLQLTTDLRALIQDSQLRVLRRSAAALAMLAVVLLGLIIFAFEKNAEAIEKNAEVIRALKEANELRALAEKRREEAERDRQLALKEKHKASRQEAEAIRQAGLADAARKEAERARAYADQRLREAVQAKKDAEEKLASANTQFKKAKEELARSEALKEKLEYERNAFEEEKRLARSRELAAYATLELQKDSSGQRSLLLALEAVKERKTEEAQDALRMAYFQESQAPAVLAGHTSGVGSLTFSPNGNYLATEAGDATARIWNVNSGRQLHVLKGLTGPYPAVAFSPDSKYLITEHTSNERQKGWEAMVWSVESGAQLFTLRGHQGAITSINFDHDGKLVITTSEDGTARLWSAKTGQALRTLNGHIGPVNSAAFSHDGKLVVTASWDKTARLWDAETGKALRALEGHTEQITNAAFSPDREFIVTTSKPNTASLRNTKEAARVWRTETGELVTMLSGHDRWINGAAFSPNGRWIVTASDDLTARIWDAQTGKSLVELRHTGEVTSACFSHDGKLVVTASKDNTARVWEVKQVTEAGTSDLTVRLLNTFTHNQAVNSAVFSPDGQTVATASEDTTARLWASRGFKTAEFRAEKDPLTGAAFSIDGQHILTTSTNGAPQVWNYETREKVADLPGHLSHVRNVAASPNGRFIVIAAGDSPKVQVRLLSGRVVASLEGHTRPVVSLAFNFDGSLMVTASKDGTARVWRTEQWPVSTMEPAKLRSLAVLSDHLGTVNDAEFSPKGQYVVTASDDYTLRVWNVTGGKPRAILKGHGHRVKQARFSPDGKLIASASLDGTVRVWNAVTGGLVAKHPHPQEVNSVAFNPESDRLVTSSMDSLVRIWDARSTRSLGVLQGHAGAVYSAEFSQDGELIVTAGKDRTARVWKMDSRSLLATLSGHTGQVNRAAFSSDSKSVVTASNDRTARVWEASTGRVLAELRGHTDRVSDAVFIQDGRYVLTASDDGAARIWDPRLGLSRYTLRSAPLNYRAAVSADGQLAVFDDGNGQVLVSNIRRQEELSKLRLMIEETELLRNGDLRINSLAFSPDSQQVAAGYSNGAARVWNTTTGALVASLANRHKGEINSIDFSPDGRLLVTASADSTASVWDAASGKTLVELAGHKSQVNSAAFSPSGKWIVTASTDGTTRIWDAATGSQLKELRDTIPLNQAAFSPDENWIVTACENPYQARLWSVRTATIVARFIGHVGPVKSAAFHPSGDLIVTASTDGVAQVFKCEVCRPFDEFLELARRRRKRELTAEEKEQFHVESNR